jgi:hypothetical protein
LLIFFLFVPILKLTTGAGAGASDVTLLMTGMSELGVVEPEKHKQ